MNKRTELEALVDLHKPIAVGITEVKPKNCRFQIQPSEISLDGYELFHTLDRDGRGISLHVKEYLKPTLIDIEDCFSESVFVNCQLENEENLVLGLIYRSPSIKEERTLIQLNQTIEKAAELKPDHLIILGDFNYPQINWKEETCAMKEDHPATKFLHATQESFLIQLQLEPTRIRDGQTPTLDDLVFTNRDDTINEITRIGALGKSDHCSLLLSLKLKAPPTRKQERYNYSKADFDKIRQKLDETDWKKELDGKNTEDQWQTFLRIVHDTKKLFVPKTRVGAPPRKPWLDNVTLELVRQKHRQYRHWLRTKNDNDYSSYLKARNKAKRACRKAKARYERDIAEQAKVNNKPFWAYVKAKTGTRTGIADLRREDGTIASTDKEKADVLNQFFQSVYTTEPDGDTPDPPNYNINSKLSDFEINEQEVKKLLKGLKVSKASGLDGIPAILLVEAADQLTFPITSIFRKSLEEGQIPSDWRQANIIPIFKKGSKCSPNNYRPVSLTSILCKVMETLVKTKVLNHMTENQLICEEQHGFTPGRSCSTQLLDTLDFWTNVLDEGGNLDAVYMDFKKAFDSVPHRRLLSKIEALGITGRVHAWITDFLKDRTQIVSVNGAASSEGKVTSGIPQGSVLGPLLFVAYINDLPRNAKNNVRIFADDTKLFAKSDTKEERDSLQKDLDSLCEWSDTWLLRFHPQKCSVMRLGNKPVEHTYTMKSTTDNQTNRHVLAETEVEKDLGVFVDKRLNFQRHVSQATAKANRTLGIMRRTFDHLTDKTFIQLYKSMIRPMLEYGHSVWSPDQKTLQREVENVQKRATKLIGRLKNSPYQERLRELKLPSLQFRRLRGDMIDAYKYTSGIYQTTYPNLELYSGREVRGHSKKLAKHQVHLKVRSNFFSERVITTWNDLPESVVCAETVNSFKSRLDKHWADHPLLYNPDCLTN